MSTAHKNLSSYKLKTPGKLETRQFALVVSEWNEEITDALYSGALETLLKYGARRDRIYRKNVPGSFELPLGAQWMARQDHIDAVICLGCVIQGETRHFEFICNAVADGLMQVGLRYNKPVVFGVLTTDTMQQALDRAGGKHGNKGDEAAATAISMLNF
jgi:6,7-dimethyl-8-ribityllumazine synthase